MHSKHAQATPPRSRRASLVGRTVGRIQGPDLVGSGDGELTQQAGVDLVPWLRFARVRLGCQRLNAHAAHERSDVAPACMNAFAVQLTAQLTCAHEGVLQVPPRQNGCRLDRI